MRGRLLAIVIGALWAVWSGAACADPAFWRIDGPKASVFLVGSTPAVPADGRWRTPALRAAIEGAQEIWLLAPIGLPGPVTALRMLATIQSQGWLPEGERLSSMLTPDARARLARLAQAFDVSLDRLDRMTPWNAQVTLSLAFRKKDGSIKGLPLERWALELAPRANRRAFDNLETDLKLLISTPRKEQIYDLEEAMRRYEDPALNARYGEAWAGGDLAWILRERETPLKVNAPLTYEILQIGPRQKWADQIAAIVKSGKPAVVILEAANFVGPEGLPALLRRRGLDVKGP